MRAGGAGVLIDPDRIAALIVDAADLDVVAIVGAIGNAHRRSVAA